MDSKRIPEIPPYPLRHSISLYSLSDVLRPLPSDEIERVNNTNEALIPERQPEPLFHEIDLYPCQQGPSSTANSSFIPEALPIPLKHQISLFSFEDISEPIPQMDNTSLQLNIPLDQVPNSPPSVTVNTLLDEILSPTATKKPSTTPELIGTGQPSLRDGATVFSVAFSPDGSLVVSGSGNGTIQLWDTETGILESFLKGHLGSVSSVAFSLDGLHIASGSDDNTVRLWDIVTKELQCVFKGHLSTIFSVVFSPDGKYIGSGSGDKDIQLWDTETGEVLSLLKGHTGTVFSVAFSPDGKHIVSGSDDKDVRLWRTATGEVSLLEGHESAVLSVAFSPDGKYIMSGSVNGTIRLWDVETGKALGPLPLKGDESPVISVAFSRDGSYIFSGLSNGTIQRGDTVIGEPLVPLLKVDESLSIAFSLDRMKIVSVSRNGTIQLGNIVTGKLLQLQRPVPSSLLASSLRSLSSPTSSRTSTPRVLAPSSPISSPEMLSTDLPPSSEEPSTLPLRVHESGHSTSDLVQLPDLAGLPIINLTPSSLSSSGTFPNNVESMIRAEQTKELQSTRKRVAQAVASASGTAAEVLYINMDLPDIAGLKSAVDLLLKIWEASQMVDMNRLGCLRLTERCANILISIRQEIADAGDVLGQELAAPIRKLEESFEVVHHFLIKQTNRPFLMRYLMRDQILQDISACNTVLRDAFGLFGISIQIRILRQVQEAEKRRQLENKALLEPTTAGRAPLPTPDSKRTIEGPMTPTSNLNYRSDTVAHLTTTENALGLFEDHPPIDPSISPENLSPSQIIQALADLHSVQNSLDTAIDSADLRQPMRAALQTTSDAQMLEVLQIGHQEMPDAIKTLQRALELATERDSDGGEGAPGPGEVMAKIVRKDSLKEVGEPGGSRKWSKTTISIDSSTSTSGGSSRRDTLDREFIESGIEALQRMSYGLETSLPSWTITKYEVDRNEKIGIGFFSDVYKGTWRGQTVAIKVLAESTPRKLFIREIGIWKTLRHANVLPLFGASSASGDPPWFFVSPYMENGSLVEHLRRVELEERHSNLGSTLSPIRSPGSNLQSRKFPPPETPVRTISLTRRNLALSGSGARMPPQEDTTVHREWDLFRFMHEIAKGMEYLHSRDILHGDLKCANVFIDDEYRCVIADFGQSEMKSEAYRISGNPPPHGTLRWQSPELMSGQSKLTQEVDIWAFSICCVEILTMGRIPWPLMDDDSVRYSVLQQDSRPRLPHDSRFNTQGLQEILRACWSTNPMQRPTFSKLVKDLKSLRKNSGQEIVDSPGIPAIDEIQEVLSSPSPEMRLALMPGHLETVNDDLQPPVSTEDMKMSQPVIYTPQPSSSSLITPGSQSDEPLSAIDYDGYDSPPPADERIANTRNERRYRLLLTHDYHPSLTLPLWDPSPVEVGAVGYLSKPRGHFVTLFNALTPGKAKHLGIQFLPSIRGYGPVKIGTHRQHRRTVVQRSVDAITGLLTFPTFSEKVSRRYSYPLKAGHKIAYLCTETTDYKYLEKLDAPKNWFQTHVDFIIQTYGSQHRIHKEDLFLIIGTLSTPNYGLFVNHSHPEGHVHFNVYATTRYGQPWGSFTTDQDVVSRAGPAYEVEPGDKAQETKVSKNRGRFWDTVLLARLRFKPDTLEPTSL